MQVEMRPARWLSPAAKDMELASWERAKADRAAKPPQGFTGGYGWPDPEIYAHVDRLNGLHRLCTLQSCAGHRCTKELHCTHCAEEWARTGFEPDAHVWDGQLWLWPDEKLGRWFYENVHRLAVEPCVEKASVLWHVEGREIIDIQFKGAGTGGLQASMAVICAFFERGNMECNL